MMNRPFFLSALCAGLLVLSGCVRNASTPGVGSGNPDLGPLSDAGAVQGGSDGSMADAASGTDVGSSPGADASMSTPDGAAPAATCDGVCDRFVECAADLCPEASALVLRASCRLACMDAPAFAALASSVDECSDLVTFVGRRSPEIGMRCDLGSEADPLCAAYAIRASECFSEVCPNSDELGEGIVSLFGSICEDQVSGGRWAPNFLDGIEMAMCDHPLIGPMIEYLTVRGEGEDSGGFEALCEDGPVTAGETCHAACDFIGDCIPAGTPNEQGGWLADYDVCRWVCGTSPDIDPEVWACISVKNECGAAFDCFDNPDGEPAPQIDECAPYSQFVAECIVAECAAAEAVRGGVARVSRDGCDKSVEDNEMNPEAVAAITAAGECDHATVRGYMDYFLRRTVDGTGALEGLCQGMPVNEPALCGAACAHLSPCIPEDDMSESAPLREPAVCEYFCVTNPAVQTDAWQCVADNDACNAVFGCF